MFFQLIELLTMTATTNHFSFSISLSLFSFFLLIPCFLILHNQIAVTSLFLIFVLVFPFFSLPLGNMLMLKFHVNFSPNEHK